MNEILARTPGVTAHDAIGEEKCKFCRWWHNPKAQPMGCCVAPGRLQGFLLGMAPASPIANPSGQQGVTPIVRGFFPTTAPDDGCGDWKSRANRSRLQS